MSCHWVSNILYPELGLSLHVYFICMLKKRSIKLFKIMTSVMLMRISRIALPHINQAKSTMSPQPWIRWTWNSRGQLRRSRSKWKLIWEVNECLGKRKIWILRRVEKERVWRERAPKRGIEIAGITVDTWRRATKRCKRRKGWI